MSRTIRLTAMAALLAGAALLPRPAAAQGFGDRLKRAAGDAAKRKVEERVDERSGQATDAAMDATEQGAKGAVKGSKGDTAKTKGASSGGASSGAASDAGSSGTGAEAQRPGTGAWVNYDFVPGERVIFAEDFSRDGVGDFPRRLELASGNMEVAEWGGRRWLRVAEGEGKFTIPLPETLPTRFTIEFDYAGIHWNPLVLRFDARSDEERPRVEVGSWGAGVVGPGEFKVVAAPSQGAIDGVAHVRLMVDGRYVKVYVDEKRVANVPRAELGRADRIEVSVPAEDKVALVTNLRVAEGGRDLYEALASSGRAVTHGLYFDTGSDRLRPESTPTLQRMAALLAAHGDLRVRIEGHTDDVGDAVANRTLSARRAEAVKQWLVAQHVDAARLETAGLGATKPAAPNATAEGRQTNRRVELVKI